MTAQIEGATPYQVVGHFTKDEVDEAIEESQEAIKWKAIVKILYAISMIQRIEYEV